MAWAAGFLDGEGSILVGRGVTNGTSIYYSLQLTAAQVDPAPLHRLAALFGGSVYLSRAGRGNQVPIHKWSIAAQKALAALRSLLPYFVVKEREARLAVRYQQYKAGRGALRHTPGAEVSRNLFYKAALEQCKADRKTAAWARAA